LLENLSPEHIKDAVEIIKNNYREYVNNCYRAAEVYDFRANLDAMLTNIGSPLSEG
jgi:hypothetical protein